MEKTERRDKIDLISQVLTLIRMQPIEKTYLLFKMNTSHTQMKTYLKKLELAGFITEKDRVLSITDKGKSLDDMLLEYRGAKIEANIH